MGRGKYNRFNKVGILLDAETFNEFIKKNMPNEKFKKFGQENNMSDVRQLWYDTRIKREKESLHEISIEDAIDTVRDNIPDSILKGWFINADSDYKPKLIDAIVSNPGVLNAGLNIAYNNYKNSVSGNPMPFEKWLKTPMTVYRGEYGQSQVANDLFSSFTPDKKVAQSFGNNLTTKKIRPIDTLGSFQTTGEQEYLVFKKMGKKK